eukprot:g17192.t1
MTDALPDRAQEGTEDDLLAKEKSYLFEERIETADRLRQLGNERFKRGHMEDAAQAYERALYHVDFDELQINFDFNEKHRETLTAAKLPVLLNLCQCLAKSGGGRGENAGRAAEYAGQAIELDSTCAKAYFWRGKARMDAGDLDGSATDLQQAAKLAPEDQAKPIRFALKSLRIKQKEAKDARRRLWGGMFKGRGGSNPAPGQRQLEEAAARARGEGVVGPRTGGGDDDKLTGGDWWLYVSIAVGVVGFAVAGFAAAKFTQGEPPVS